MVIIPLKEAREKYAMQIRKIYLKFILILPGLAIFSFFRFPFTWRIIASRCHESREKEPVYGAKR